jgi:hypothetical protein
MLNRVNKILIGKDISRNASAVAGANIKTLVSALADGEVLVLDKNKDVLAAGATIADSDTIYICQATSKTFDYTNELGTAVTGARELIFSDPIQGKHVRSYKGQSYAAATECSVAYVLTALHPVTLGREYFIRLVYTDMEEYPSQFTQTYRYTAVAGDVSAIDTFGANFAAKINAHAGRRVQATYTDGTDTLLITGKAVPESTGSTADIDEYKQVTFKAFFNYVDSTGKWQAAGVTSTTAVVADPGQGTWPVVRDIEKWQFPYKGVSNFTAWPIIVPAFSTVAGAFYDLIVIEHEQEYMSPGINTYQTTTLTTIIALATASTGINASTQKASVLAQLNPWMASVPGHFASVTI